MSRRQYLAFAGATAAGLLVPGLASAQEDPRRAHELFHRYGVDQQTVTVATRTGHYDFLVALVGIGQDHTDSALIARRRLDPDEGVLYTADYVQPLGISNQGVSFPTDLLFASGDGRVIEIHAGILPNDSQVITSTTPVKAAMQLIAGSVARISAAPGDHLLYPLFGRTL
jgi:uncharacterized membrane protein (UPF0127 family)